MMKNALRLVLAMTVLASVQPLSGACAQGDVATAKPKLPRPVAGQGAPQGVAAGRPKVGTKVNSIQVVDLDGKELDLASLWSAKPVLLVTASMTCPKSRTSCASLAEIGRVLGQNCDVVIVYTIEAHPKGSDSPYRPGKGEWLTAINEKQGILRAQPKTMDERMTLAKELDAKLESKSRMVVDLMNNGVWRTIAMAPNSAILIDTAGVVRLNTEWLNTKNIVASVNGALFGTTEPNADKADGDAPQTPTAPPTLPPVSTPAAPPAVPAAAPPAAAPESNDSATEKSFGDA